MAITRIAFGNAGSKEIDLYSLRNANGLRVRVMTFGAIVTSIEVPDRAGSLEDVVLGFDSLAGYLGEHPYFGATVGRVGNRIRDGRFELDGGVHQLTTNEGAHHLHGGVRGWDTVVWNAEAAETPKGPAVKLNHRSLDGDEGYPGAVNATCMYTLTDKDELRIEMRAVTDKATIINIVHHSYWNLGGDRSGPITDHELTLYASRYTPGNPTVPFGEIADVVGTPLDFTRGKRVGQDLAAWGASPTGYDHNFVVDGAPHDVRPVARLAAPTTGRVLTLEANQPGVQFYTGNFLDGVVRGKGGRPYVRHGGLCLESQAFPNAINVPGWRDQVVLRPGTTYEHLMIHRFTTE